MPKKIKKTVEEVIIDQYIQGERDFRKIGKKHDITSSDVMEILEKNGII